MTRFGFIRDTLLAMGGLLICVSAVFAHAQTTQITTEYLMTAEAPFDPPVRIDNSMVIVPGRAGGWVKGPRINGKIVFSGDSLRVMPSGVWRLDVRALIQTDDNAVIYASFNGIVQHSKESFERWRKGEVLSSKDIPYFVAADVPNIIGEVRVAKQRTNGCQDGRSQRWRGRLREIRPLHCPVKSIGKLFSAVVTPNCSSSGRESAW